ncbi:hypothetical protein [Gimesia maris]|uniref:hypothetical protein n=1 Tax=Gimesia maris TaxID=122 RepID=UPI0032EB9C40
MSYEEEENYMVLDEGGEYISQHATLEEAEAALKKIYFEQDCNPDTSIGHGDGASVVLVCTVADLNLSADEFYDMKPTLAWQQLQDELRQGREAVEKLEWATKFLKRLQIEINTSEDPVEQAEDYFGNWDDLVNEREAELVELRASTKEQRESK